MLYTTTLTNAAPRIVNKRDGSGSFTLFELFDHEGTAWVVKQDVYNVAQNWIGQPVQMTVRVEQNGQWTNRFADIVQLAQGQPMQQQGPMQSSAMQAVGAAQSAQAQAGRAVQPQQQNYQPEPWPTQKDRSIHRQTAAKVAAALQPTSASEFWSNVQDLAAYFDSGAVPDQQPQYAGAAMGNDYGSYQHGDDDAPPF